jgi:hypothetical protein
MTQRDMKDFRLLCVDSVWCNRFERICYDLGCINHGCMGFPDIADEVGADGEFTRNEETKS